MSDSIQVAIKVRPLIKREKDENLPIQWAVVNNAIVPVDPEKKRGENGFQFDHIFDSEKTNNHVFKTVVKPIVDAAVRGFNGTVFAYGQTSSGKTHTMLGTANEPGIIPMAVDHVFDSIADTRGREFLLRVSYLEIYNEKVNDLLDTSGVDLKLREDSNGLVQVLKSKEEIANSPDLIMAIMKKGDKNRRIGETDMNERSSRSHTIFRITIESRDQVSDSDGAVQVAQLNLVDLAGSERARQTNTTGERFKEGTHINMSLSTLGLVIKQLSESSDTTKYINFRDSKLTRLLQASLGGNAMTVIICAVTPAAFEETMCTLWFASRAKSVKNKPQLNEVMSDAALLKRCKKLIAKLHEDLEKAKYENRVAHVQEMESKLQEKEHKLRVTGRINQLLEERIYLLENNIISTNGAGDYNNKKIPRSTRRRTWAGDRASNGRFSLNLENLPTIKENPCTSPDSKLNGTEKPIHIRSRKSIIQTVDLNNESFETDFADFELDMIKVIKEREEEMDTSVDIQEKKEFRKVKLKNENRVKFQDDVEIHRFSSGSTLSDVSTSEKQNFISDQEELSLDSLMAKLQEKLTYITKEYQDLQEYTILERQVLFAEQKNFESSGEKIFMQKQIYELLERLKKHSINKAELDEKLSISLNCINGLMSRTPEILELWKQSLFNNEKDEADTFDKLKELQELLTYLKNEKNSEERLLTSLEKKLTDDYNACLQDLDQLRMKNEKIIMENTKIKKELSEESNKLKNSDTLINTLRIDTDCLMKKLLQKDSELSKLKERIVEHERISNDPEKSIINKFEISIKKDCDEDLSTKIHLASNTNQDRDKEILKLNEIIQAKETEINKYKRFEEEMKIENSSLKEALEAASKTVKISQECQTEINPADENENKDEKNMINEINQEKHENVSKLFKLIQEQDISIKHHQQIKKEMEKKIEELHQYLDTNKVERISQECQTENLRYCENNLSVNQTNSKDIEISSLLEKNEKQIVEIDRELKKDNKEEIEQLQDVNTSIINKKQILKECQLLDFDSHDENTIINSNSIKDIEISRLENIIQEKSFEIERLQLRLANENKGETISKKCQTKDILENEKSEVSQVISADVEMYQQFNREIKLETEQLQETLANNSKIEQISEEYKIKHFAERCNKNSLYEDQVDEIENQQIIQTCIFEIETYNRTKEEMKNKIKWLQQNLDNTRTIEQRTMSCQTEILLDNNERNEIDLKQEKNKEMNDLIEMVKEKEFDIIQFKQSEEEKRKEIECLQRLDTAMNMQRVSKECQTECNSDITEYVTIDSNEETAKEILRLSMIIEEKSLEIANFKQLEKETKEEIKHLQQRLDAVTNIQQISKECQTQYISDIAKHIKINVNEEKDNAIELSKTIKEEKSHVPYKQLEKEITKEIESVQQDSEHLVKFEYVNEEAHIEVPKYDNEKVINQLDIPDQIAHYQEEIKTLLTTNAEFEAKVISINNQLAIKIKNIEELSSLISVLKNEIIQKTSEMSNLQQVVEIKVQKLEQKIDGIVLEKNEIMGKISSIYSTDLAQEFDKEDQDSQMIIKKLKLENDILKKKIQTFEIKYNDEINLSTTNYKNLVDNITNSVKNPIVYSEKNESECVVEENTTIPLDSNKFSKPDDVLVIEKKDSSTKLNESAAMNDDKSFVKPLNRKCELELSSIFANMTYFDEMEVSQSFSQDTTLTVIDEIKDISNVSTNVYTEVVNNVTINEGISNTSVLFENSKNISKLEDVPVTSPVNLKNKLHTMVELEKIKAALEKENKILHYSLEQKIHAIEEFKRELSDFNQKLKQLNETVYILNNENQDLTKQLKDTSEKNNEVNRNLQMKVDTLTDRLSSVTEENTFLKNEVEVLNNQFENMRDFTSVITDDEIKLKISEYQENIKSLTKENIELSTNLMEMVEELEKVKESKIQLYDHQCSFREKSEELDKQLQYLQKENIELSSDLTEHIEECDMLKETVDVLKQQMEAYKNQECSNNSSEDNEETLKQKNIRLTCELIELKAYLTQLSRENVSLSTITFDNIGKQNESPIVHEETVNVSTIKLERSMHEDNTINEANISLQKEIVKHSQKEEHLMLLNKKLGDLKFTNCSNCIYFKELNESRRNLKLEVKLLNNKLATLKNNFQQKCLEITVLKEKVNEEFNTSSNLIDSTLDGSNYEGMNLTLIEEKVRNLQNELEETKENHNKLSNNYREKCNELEKLQLDNISFASPVKKTKRLDSNSSCKNSRLQTLKEILNDLCNDVKELKKSNNNNTSALIKLKKEKTDNVQEIESLKLANENLKKECDNAQSNASNYEEKVNLLEEELSVLYKQIETASLAKKKLEAQKLEIEVKFEMLLKEKEEFVSSLQCTEEKFRKKHEDYDALVHKFDKENVNLKNEIQKLEDIIHQSKDKNESYSEKKLQEEIELAKSRMLKEIKSLTILSENEWKNLLNKSVTDIFLRFLKAIISKEQEMVKKLHEDHEKAKRKLEEEKQQSIDSERRTKDWAKTVEVDFEKVQADLTKQEHKNKRFEDEVMMFEKHLKEAHHENEKLMNNIHDLELEINSLHYELDKKSKVDVDRDAAIIAVEEKERIARVKEEEWENRLKEEKEEYDRKLSEVNKQLESYKSTIDDLKNTIEGLDVQIEHLKNTIDSKTNDCTVYMCKFETTMQDIEYLKEINQQLKNENSEKNKHINEITDLLKIKCDLLSEYKTKVETMKPEYESLQTQVAEREMSIEKRKEEIHCLKMENKKQIDVLQDKLSAEEIKSEGLNKQLHELKNKNTTLYSTLEECKDRCGELERENGNLLRKIRNSTSKVQAENEMKDLQDENRSLKNHLEGSYNRIKALQESKSQVQTELTVAQGKNSLLEQELNTTKISLESLREKYNNMNLQKLRDNYELLLREKKNIILEIEEKKMLIANKDQKLVEYSIEIDTLKKQKEALDKEIENVKRENSLLENRILDLVRDSQKLNEKIVNCDIQKDEICKVSLEEKNKISLELENCRKEISDILSKNKELNDEMNELVGHIHKQESEIADLQDRLIVGSSNEGNIEKLKNLEDNYEKLKIDLRVTEINRNKLQNEVIQLNTEKELLVNKVEELNGKISELKSKNSSRSSSKSNSPTSQIGRRRHRRSDLFNKNRNLDIDSDAKEVSDTDSPSITPTPIINSIYKECQTCNEFRNQIREMSLDLVSRNNKITMLEVQLQTKKFPYQIKCNELQENLLEVKTRNSEYKLEIKKLQRALMEDCSRECQICRHRKHNKRDQSVQVNPETKISMTGMSSGIVEDHLRLEKMKKERNWMKDLCRNRARKIKELEQYIRELEELKTC